MGLFGAVFHGARALYGFVTEDYEMVDSAVEKGKKSMALSIEGAEKVLSIETPLYRN